MSEKLRVVFKLRGLVMVPLVLFLVFWRRGEYENDWVVFPLGGALFACGLSLRIWAQVHLHYRLNVHKILTMTGPYAYVRNPIYIGNTLILLSLCAMSELMWSFPIMLLWCIFVYHFVVRYEESHLTAKYGTPYREFLQSVPRWWPRRASRSGERAADVWRYLLPSIRAELHCFIWVVPFVLKELAG
ncbi:MAG: hypothetical protein QG656_693 [Candidatus Hydrogenedentes bacterium]|nr:hypothetical protein [Candidatus Hydrogenedentota bacterium]